MNWYILWQNNVVLIWMLSWPIPSSHGSCNIVSFFKTAQIIQCFKTKKSVSLYRDKKWIGGCQRTGKSMTKWCFRKRERFHVVKYTALICLLFCSHRFYAFANICQCSVDSKKYQTWYLSNILHSQIFRLKVLHHKSA